MKILKLAFLLLIIFAHKISLDARESSKLSFAAGSLLMSVDQLSGRFGLRDTKVSEFALSSLLFDPGFPTSYIEITINGTPYRLDQLKAIYPLGVAVGHQIDAVYQWQNDLHIELGYFAMDVQSNFDAMGIAVRISNISTMQDHQVSVKLMLDTDVSEIHRQPLIYLDDGSHIAEPQILQGELPRYFFLGQQDESEETAGVYLYPSISTNSPTAIVIGNWKYLTETVGIPSEIKPSFTHHNSENLDIGLGIYFDKKTLRSGQHYDVVAAISLNKHESDFILNDMAMNKGVFASERFEIEELLNYLPKNPQMMMPMYNSSQAPQQMNTYQRQQYRQQKLRMTPQEMRQNPEKTSEYFGDLVGTDSIWKHLYKINGKMENLEEKINKAIELNY
ncbi:MAG: hypothetical protein ACRCS8_03915 [Brevinema sp.]